MKAKQLPVAGQPAGPPPGEIQILADAMRHYQAGRLDEGAALYRRILAANARHADSLHMLGLIAHRAGQRDTAIDLIGRAITIDGGIAAYHSNLGNMRREQGRLDEAVACFDRALGLQPEFADAHYNLGIALVQQGRLEAAVACYRKALTLRPDFPGAHYNLGGALMTQRRLAEAVDCFRSAVALGPDFAWGHYSLGHALAELGRLEEAIECYRRALALRPDFLEARNNLGNLLKQQGNVEEAAACYRTVLSLRPDFPEVTNNLGIVLGEQGRLDEAVACYREALVLRPDFAETHNNLGHALEQMGQTEAAMACFRRTIDLQPGMASAHYNLGNALRDQRQLDEAVGCYRTALTLRPDYPEACNNLGNVLREQGRLDEAVGCLRRAIELRPDFADAHGNLGIALLARGELPEGWEEYEWRWKTPPMRGAARDFAQPQWHGEAGAGRTLLVHAEQGLGDTLQFCRYVTLAAEQGLRVAVEVQKPLVRLLTGLAGADVVVGRGEALPQFDLHCPMLSLPRALGTTLATVPSAQAYLWADETRVADWQRRLAVLGEEVRVGLAWAGSSMLPSDVRRSLAPDRLAPLLAVRGVRFFSLQKERSVAPEGFPLVDYMPEMADFADTAALVGALDLVISVDTAVAHLAAAMGQPMWMLDRFDPDWRWVVSERDSPWYPTLRIYRQARPEDWDGVLAEVVRDLRAFARR